MGGGRKQGADEFSLKTNVSLLSFVGNGCRPPSGRPRGPTGQSSQDRSPRVVFAENTPGQEAERQARACNIVDGH